MSTAHPAPTENSTPKKNGKRNALVAGLIVAGLAVGSGVYVTEGIYKPQLQTVINLETQVSALPVEEKNFYGDERAENFYEDPVFETKEWKDYYALTEDYRSDRIATDVQVFRSEAASIWFPGLTERAEIAAESFEKQGDSSEFTHFMLAATATTLACDASGHDHVHIPGVPVDESNHTPEDLAEDKLKTQEFIDNWKEDELPMINIVHRDLSDPTDEEKKVVRTAFTKAMEAGLPYFCP